MKAKYDRYELNPNAKSLTIDPFEDIKNDPFKLFTYFVNELQDNLDNGFITREEYDYGRSEYYKMCFILPGII